MEQDVKQVGKFHHNIGANIVLLEEGTVAYRNGGFADNGVVFTKCPITTGALFEVKIEKIAREYVSGLVSTILLSRIYNHTITQ